MPSKLQQQHKPSPHPPQHRFRIVAPFLKGAHAAPFVRVPPCCSSAMASHHHDKPLFLFTSLLLLPFFFVASHGLTEAETLLKIKSSLSNASALANWDVKVPPCKGKISNWVGVLCAKGIVQGLQLENMGLTGKIDVDSISSLPSFRTFSFINNNFNGPLPELKKITALKSVFLSKNQFSGVIPEDAFSGMVWLKKLHLAENKFTGPIPASLATLPKLLDLRLDGNQFDGTIPDFKQQGLEAFNASNNALSGPIPAALSKVDAKMFSGNKDLCGKPLDPCGGGGGGGSGGGGGGGGGAGAGGAGAGGAGAGSKKPSLIIIVIIVIVVVVVLLVILAAILCRKKQPSGSIEAPPSNLQKKSCFKDSDNSSHGSSSRNSPGGKKAEAKLSFVREDREKFDLPDLLKANAEILGSGCFGSSYKAALTTGPVMVVKRFKQMNNVGKEEFQEHMRRLGRLRHENLLPLVAYYYRKEEKLLVSDFVTNGSLAVQLHGHQALGRQGLDWPTRLKIVKGVAKGMAYLHKELPSLIAPHGHLKSSNVLLDENFEPLLTDYGLTPVINQESAQDFMVAYKSPEYTENGRITKKTDVWGLGILILEILTGKFPANFLQKGKGTEEDLAIWVNSVVREERTADLFDKEMEVTKSSEGEMMKLLNIGLSFCEGDVEKRLDLKDAVERIEELKERDGEEDFYSSVASDVDKKSSRGLSDEFAFS